MDYRNNLIDFPPHFFLGLNEDLYSSIFYLTNLMQGHAFTFPILEGVLYLLNNFIFMLYLYNSHFFILLISSLISFNSFYNCEDLSWKNFKFFVFEFLEALKDFPIANLYSPMVLRNLFSLNPNSSLKIFI